MATGRRREARKRRRVTRATTNSIFFNGDKAPALNHGHMGSRGHAQVLQSGQLTPHPSAGLGSSTSAISTRTPDRRQMSRSSPGHGVRPSWSSLVSPLKMLRAQESAHISFPLISGVQSRTSTNAHSTLTQCHPPPTLSSCTSEWLNKLLHACPPAGEKGLV